jgi:DNA-binding transcriptional LysR family regulator
VPKVLADEVEFGIGHFLYGGTEIGTETIATGPLTAVLKHDPALAGRMSISWDEVVARPVILAPRGTSLRMLIDETLAAHRKRLRPCYEPLLFATAVSLAEQGLGISIVPSYFSLRLHPDLMALPIVEPVIQRDLAAITKAGRPLAPQARAFLDRAKALLAGAPAAGPAAVD